MAQIEGNPAYIPAKDFVPKIEHYLKLLETKAVHTAHGSMPRPKIKSATRSGANFEDKAIDIAKPTFNARIPG